jgi:hypothetical protein
MSGVARVRFAGLTLVLAAVAVTGCGDATSERLEELTDPGPRDASFDGALSFDGVDDYASVGTARAPQIMRDQSFMLWFRPDGAASGAGGDLQVLFTFRRSGWSGVVLALDRDVPLAYNVFAERDLARWPAEVAPGAWHHLAFVIHSDSSELFLDGVASPTPGNAPLTNRTPTQAFIGSLDGYADMFHGALDELRVYDRAFTAEEIAAVAAGARPDDAEPLVIYLPFDEAGGGRSYDRSGLGNHAELGDGVAQLMPTRIRSDVP